MPETSISLEPSGRLINTLAQTDTQPLKKGGKKQPIFITGKGTDISQNPSLLKRAKKKLIVQKTILSMIDFANEHWDFDTAQSYWNTYHCQGKIQSYQGKLYGKYCKNRLCPLCCGIRKADIINRYLPIMQDWEQPYFVTLTVKAISENRLKAVIDSMFKGFQKIQRKYKTRHQRCKGFKFVGIKSLECNFNPEKKTYNPHFHLIVESQKMAETLIEEWLTCSKPNWTNRKAQDARPVNNLEKNLIEIIKYSSKIFSDPDGKPKKSGSSGSTVYAKALHTINKAMKNHRIFDRFGFNLPKTEKVKYGSKSITEYLEWEFHMTQNDWINSDSDEVLTGYNPPAELIDLLDNKIDNISF